MSTWVVPVRGKELDKAFISQLASLWKSIHSFSYFNHNMAIVDKWGEVVFMHDRFRDGPDGDPHVLIPFHRCAEVKIGNVKTVETCTGSGDCAVEHEFSSGDIGCESADYTRVVDQVATNSEADAMRFRFLWAIINNNVEICGFAVGWKLVMANEVDGVGAFDVSILQTLCQSTYFIRTALKPYFACCGLGDELLVCEGSARSGV